MECGRRLNGTRRANLRRGLLICCTRARGVPKNAKGDGAMMADHGQTPRLEIALPDASG